jgi:hypothetical protein
MRACFLGQNICVLGSGVAILQSPPIVLEEPPKELLVLPQTEDQPATDHSVTCVGGPARTWRGWRDITTSAWLRHS